MPTCKLDNQGRIVLPAKWRNMQGVSTGTELLILEEDGKLIVQTRMQAVRDAQRMVHSAIPGRVSLVSALMRERRDEVAREASTTSGRRRRRA